MENVQNFQKALKAYGVPDIDVFQTVDLFEKKDIAQVTNTFFALGRAVWKDPNWNGPKLGPKPADANEREFTEEQLKAGQTIVGLQAGQNKGKALKRFFSFILMICNGHSVHGLQANGDDA